MSIRLFNTLSFKRQEVDGYSGDLKRTITMQAYVPGVNSGVYDKALHITIHQTKPFKFHSWLKWKFGSKEVMVSDITLKEQEMINLRDEINQILRLPFNKGEK